MVSQNAEREGLDCSTSDCIMTNTAQENSMLVAILHLVHGNNRRATRLSATTSMFCCLEEGPNATALCAQHHAHTVECADPHTCDCEYPSKLSMWCLSCSQSGLSIPLGGSHLCLQLAFAFSCDDTSSQLHTPA